MAKCAESPRGVAHRHQCPYGRAVGLKDKTFICITDNERGPSLFTCSEPFLLDLQAAFYFYRLLVKDFSELTHRLIDQAGQIEIQQRGGETRSAHVGHHLLLV